MYKNLYIFFKYLKFHYNYYNLILVRSERSFQNSFFKNKINKTTSFNLNFLLDTHWSFLNKKTSYSLGFSSSFFNFKTVNFFFNFLSTHFYFQNKNSLVSNFSISSSDRKNSRKLWKYKLVSVILNFTDWSVFFKNNVKKSKILFLFGASHPLQSTNIQSLRQYDLDAYNKNSIDFNVDISDNNSMNQSKELLLSEIFFFNNTYDCDLDVLEKPLSFFLFKVFSLCKIFNVNKLLFCQPTVFNFYFFVNYPFYFKNNVFNLESNKDFAVSANFFYDKNNIDGVYNLSNFNIFIIKSIVVSLCKSSHNFLLNSFLLFTSISLLSFYGTAKKKKKCYSKKSMKKKSN